MFCVCIESVGGTSEFQLIFVKTCADTRTIHHGSENHTRTCYLLKS